MPQIVYLSASYTLPPCERSVDWTQFVSKPPFFFYHLFYLFVLSTFQRQCKGRCMFPVAAFIWLAMSYRSQSVLIANKTKVNTEREETTTSACSHTEESAPFLCLQPLAALSLILPYLHPFQLSCFLRSSTFNTSLADGWNQTNWQTDLRKSNVTFLLSPSTSHLIAILAFSVSSLFQPPVPSWHWTLPLRVLSCGLGDE